MAIILLLHKYILHSILPSHTHFFSCFSRRSNEETHLFSVFGYGSVREKWVWACLSAGLIFQQTLNPKPPPLCLNLLSSELIRAAQQWVRAVGSCPQPLTRLWQACFFRFSIQTKTAIKATNCPGFNTQQDCKIIQCQTTPAFTHTHTHEKAVTSVVLNTIYIYNNNKQQIHSNEAWEAESVLRLQMRTLTVCLYFPSLSISCL